MRPHPSLGDCRYRLRHRPLHPPVLENGNRVFGVEPNADMRKAGEEYLAAYPHFTSVAGSADATTLPESSVILVTAAQAAHWFDFPSARWEFMRILKPTGARVLLWNERQLDSTPFLRDYEKLLRKFGTDYDQVHHELTTSRIDEFFAPSPFHEQAFPSRQEFDYAGLKGRFVLFSTHRRRATRSICRWWLSCGRFSTSPDKR